MTIIATITFAHRVWVVEAPEIPFIRSGKRLFEAVDLFDRDAREFLKASLIVEFRIVYFTGTGKLTLKGDKPNPPKSPKNARSNGQKAKIGKKYGICELCQKLNPLTRHHLIPKSVRYDDSICLLCRGCHDLIHWTFSNRELAEKYNTVEKLINSSIGLFLPKSGR